MADELKIKVCGITRTEDAMLAAQLGAYALGFIFYQKSPRYIAPTCVKDILKNVPAHVKRVGVFVNASPESIRETAAVSGIDIVQLHGDEAAAFSSQLRGMSVWKAFRLKSADQFSLLPSYESSVDAFLFDAAVAGQYGGTGHTVDWDLLEQAPRRRPLIVSGGLHPGNIAEAWRRFKPYALDLSSGVESSPGIKDHSKLKQLFAVKG